MPAQSSRYQKTLKRRTKAFGYSLLLTTFCLAPTASLATEIVAQARHDFGEGAKLISFQAEPLEAFAQAEQLAQGTFGDFVAEIRTPATPFICTWRDLDHFNATVRPLEPFLVCSFSPEFIATRGSLLEMAQVYNTVDRAHLRASWRLEGDDYTLQRFAVELLSGGQTFRSINIEDEIHDVQIFADELEFPESSEDMLRFTLRSQVPGRYNSSDEPGEPLVTVMFSGTAEPIPNWVNY